MNGKKKKFLISPWGKPDYWKEVHYSYKQKVLQSKTSLYILQRSLHPDYLIIIVLDTIGDRSGSYRDIINEVREKIREFCLENNININTRGIIVVPGVGSYKKVSFRGKMIDYYYWILFELICFFTEEIDGFIKRDINEIEIHLDLTHGINYMPTLTYRALREIACMLAILFKVSLHIYNSEPYSGAGQVLNIHQTEKILNVKPEFPHEYIEANDPLKLLKICNDDLHCLNETEKSRLKREIRELSCQLSRESVNTFISSLYNGLPLLIFRSYLAPDELLDCLKKAICVYNKEIKIRKNGDYLEVIRPLALTFTFSVLAKTFFLSALLESLGIHYQEEVSLNEMKELKEKIYKKFKLLNILIGNELHFLEEKLGEKINHSWEKIIYFEGRSQTSPDFRNFMSHAGLEKNITLIKKKGNEIFLKYDEDRLKNINKFAQKAIRLQ